MTNTEIKEVIRVTISEIMGVVLTHTQLTPSERANIEQGLRDWLEEVKNISEGYIN